MRSADHPRVCGKHVTMIRSCLSRAGSSPRVRETLCADSPPSLGKRIIPACAGNTGPEGSGMAPRTDHPRVCGKHPWQNSCRIFFDGSSPRVRETRSGATMASRTSRIIPACAGNTCGEEISQQPQPDHPRVCGKHKWMTWRSWQGRGSSPRVRETLGSRGDVEC